VQEGKTLGLGIFGEGKTKSSFRDSLRGFGGAGLGGSLVSAKKSELEARVNLTGEFGETFLAKERKKATGFGERGGEKEGGCDMGNYEIAFS